MLDQLAYSIMQTVGAATSKCRLVAYFACVLHMPVTQKCRAAQQSSVMLEQAITCMTREAAL